MKMPKGALDTSKDNNWKPCIICGGELIQVRKALFTCLGCSQEYIADEEDMREEVTIFKIKKLSSNSRKEKEVSKWIT